jgi:uncharacterized protein
MQLMPKYSRRCAPTALKLSTARTLALVKQGLVRRPATVNKDVLIAGIRHLGFLQLDTINVVERSHYLVMLSRLGRYDQSDLDDLHYPDRQLFEQWAHAACLLPVEDYEHFAPAIYARRKEPLSAQRAKKLGNRPAATLKSVLAAVTSRGPIMSRDFADPRGNGGTWWNHKPAKIALDWLFYTGHLMIDRRIHFQCSYDLSERVLPGRKLKLPFDIERSHRWATLRSVGCLGVGTVHHIADYYRLPMPVVRKMLAALEDSGDLLRVQVEGWREPAYMLTSDFPLLKEIKEGAHRSVVTALLSPFDNLIAHRPRTKELFEFEYRCEMYTPLAKKDRKFGYYVMPILNRGRIIGRLDPKADRSAGVMVIRSIHLEPWVRISKRLASDLSSALREFMEFHGCQTVSIERNAPSTLVKILRSKLE